MNTRQKRIKISIFTLLFIVLHGVEFVRETAIVNPVPVMNVSAVVLALLCVTLLVPMKKEHLNKWNFNVIKAGIKDNPLRSAIVALWIVFSFCAAISKSKHSWLLIYLVLFGLFLIIKINNCEKDALIKAFFLGNALGFVFVQAFAYGFRPYDEARYKGPFANSNITGLYYTLMYLMVLFFIHYLIKNKAKTIYIVLSVVAAAYLVGLVFLTVGRTALLVTVFLTGIYLLMVVWRNWKWKFTKVIMAGAAFLVLTVFMLFPTYATVRYLPGILHHPVWFAYEYSESKVHSFDPITSDKYVSLSEVFSTFLGRNVKGFVSEETVAKIITGKSEISETEIIEKKPVEKAPDAIVEHIEYEQGSLLQRIDRFSSDRIRYSIVYLRNMNFSGHPRTQEVWLDDEQVYNTQNIFLQPSWDYGIPAGVVFAVLSVLLWIYHLKQYIKNKNNVYAVFPVLLMSAFYLFGQLEVVWEYGMFVLWMFFFVQHPMFTEISED